MEGLLRFKTHLENSINTDDLEYYFNENGELRHMLTKKPFVYNYYKKEYERNHKRYKMLGDLITLYVYELLEKECNLERIPIPIDAKEEEPKSFFFMSKEGLSVPTSLLVLLQDKGVIRAGQWGQKVIFHHSLEKGTQIPYINTALREYGALIILNPNDNFVEMKEEPHLIIKKEEDISMSLPCDGSDLLRTGRKMLIPKRCCSSPEEHTGYVWDNFISTSAATNVAFIAHGYGGLVFLDLLCKKRKEVMSKVCAVAFIDSRHHSQHQARTDPEIQSWMHANCRSWVLSTKPLDRPTGSLLKLDCPKVSAGTENHELAPYKSLSSVFRFLTRSSKNRRSSTLPSRTIQTTPYKKKLK
ncbi:putative protein FAM172B [Xenopus laevis]|uniref:Arb2 domain-containing protein n=2 Tax=Xenopus laevis TaxID=8355 RepID=A0A1L8HGG1_XENLA|nr:putative protein FAM172B [Xenopus laevis]XP_018102510.1 putative protein FAM172B [Xenopus laevis]OCT95182.1 hypothetical protein XELAEV_18012867mg [Xenopus laevis]